MISSEELARLVVEEIWNRGNLELADELFAPDYVNHGGLIPDLIRCPEAIKFSVVLYRRAFPDFHIGVSDVATEENATVIRWVAHRSPPLIDGPADREGCLRGITRFRLRDGKIAESWTAWDRRASLVRWARRESNALIRPGGRRWEPGAPGAHAEN